MENASKAIIMASGILIALVIISLLVIVFNKVGDVYSAEQQSLSEEQLQKYNKQFDAYDTSLYGSELLSLANLIDDYNNKILSDEGQSGTYYNENKITVSVTLERATIGYSSSEDSSISYKGLVANKKYNISDIKEYNDALEKRIEKMEKNNVNKNNDDYTNVKSSLTELRSMPFVCTSKKYNKYGRISEMTFKQNWDNQIENVINKLK